MAGCTGGSLPDGTSAAGGVVHRDTATAYNLLYVPDVYAYGTFVFTYRPSLIRLQAFLSVPAYPVGECVDAQQSVYIAGDFHLLFEYAHGGTSPIAVLSDQAGDIEGCAVDPTTGQLAVISFGHTSSTTRLAVYKSIHAKPRFYSTSFRVMAQASYDDRGDLFIDGNTNSQSFLLQELPNGASSLETISLNESFSVPGGLQWDGKYLDVGDSSSKDVDQFDISGTRGTEVGSIALKGSQEVQQFFIFNRTLINPTYAETFEGPGYVEMYHYPAGGKPFHTIAKFTSPIAVVVSRASGAR